MWRSNCTPHARLPNTSRKNLIVTEIRSEVASDADAPGSTDADSVARPSRALEITAAAAALIVMVAFLILVQQIELRQESAPGQIDARFWPTLLGVLGVIIAARRLVFTFVTQPTDRDDLEVIRPGGMRRLALTVVLVIAYLTLWRLRSVEAFGYNINLFVFITPVLLAVLLYIYGARSWKAFAIYPIATTAFIYMIFGTLLRIPL